MHLGVHRYGLAVALRTHVIAVVVRPVMVASGRDDLAAFDEDRAKTVIHWGLERGLEGDAQDDKRADLGCCLEALRQIILGLVMHDDDYSVESLNQVNVDSKPTRVLESTNHVIIDIRVSSDKGIRIHWHIPVQSIQAIMKPRVVSRPKSDSPASSS